MNCQNEHCNGPENFCVHIRQSGRVVNVEDRYTYMVTYVGGYAILTSNKNPKLGLNEENYMTAVICVGVRSLGEVQDANEAVDRLMHVEHHNDINYVQDYHESTALMLANGMISLDA